jgi:cytoskeleton protein RodZ
LDNVAVPIGIGEQLREARVAAGIQLDEAERTIRIRVRYLHALETEDWGVLPGEAYARGFLHTYADYLGLDGAALVDEYNRGVPATDAEHPAEMPLESPIRPVGNAAWRRAGTIALVLAAGLIALFVVLAITGGSGEKGGGKPHRKGGRQTATTKTTTTTTPSEASVTLTPTGTVWVCLVDRSGKPLVNGETLTAGDSRGPFKDRQLQLTLGNGEMRIELNGKTVPIPSAANPVGFDLTPDGANPLPTSDRPTCA